MVERLMERWAARMETSRPSVETSRRSLEGASPQRAGREVVVVTLHPAAGGLNRARSVTLQVAGVARMIPARFLSWPTWSVDT